MSPTSLVATVAPRTGKINKNTSVFLKKEKICYDKRGREKEIEHFVFKLSQSEIVLQS